MSVYTYVGNVDRRDRTERIILRGGALVIDKGQYADLTELEYLGLKGQFVFAEGTEGLPAPEPRKALISFIDLADVDLYDLSGGEIPRWDAVQARWKAATAEDVVGDILAGAGVVDKYYRHQQMTPSDLWVIPHGLGKRPSVNSFDSAGDERMGDVNHIDNNNLTISFSAAIGGEAFLN